MTLILILPRMDCGNKRDRSSYRSTGETRRVEAHDPIASSKHSDGPGLRNPRSPDSPNQFRAAAKQLRDQDHPGTSPSANNYDSVVVTATDCQLTSALIDLLMGCPEPGGGRHMGTDPECLHGHTWQQKPGWVSTTDGHDAGVISSSDTAPWAPPQPPLPHPHLRGPGVNTLETKPPS